MPCSGVKLENGVEILAHTAGKMRKFRIRVMVGDKVDIGNDTYDLAKAESLSATKTDGNKPLTTKPALPEFCRYLIISNYKYFIAAKPPINSSKNKTESIPRFFSIKVRIGSPNF